MTIDEKVDAIHEMYKKAIHAQYGFKIGSGLFDDNLWNHAKEILEKQTE